MAHPHLLSRAWALAVLLATAAASHALEISPVHVSLSAAQMDGELWLHNDAPQAWSGQARLYRWEQSEEAELLEPAQDVVLSPSRLMIPAHTRQRLRVVRRGPPPEGETGYRLVIRAGPGHLPLQVSLPVFVGSPAATAPAVTAHLLAAPAGPVLQLYNAARRHTRLADLSFTDASGQRRVVIAGLAGYVLAGRTRRWPLPGDAAAYRGGRFSARLDDGPDQPLAAPSPPIAPTALPGL